MTHTVDLGEHPAAAEPLTALYLVSRSGPVNGQHKKPRQALARMIGPGPLADLLASGKPITVAPRSPSTWAITDRGAQTGALPALLRALDEEIARQGITRAELSRRIGWSQSGLGHIFRGRSLSVDLDDAVNMLRALGKDLTWFEANYLSLEPSPVDESDPKFTKEVKTKFTREVKGMGTVILTLTPDESHGEVDSAEIPPKLGPRRSPNIKRK